MVRKAGRVPTSKCKIRSNTVEKEIAVRQSKEQKTHKQGIFDDRNTPNVTTCWIFFQSCISTNKKVVTPRFREQERFTHLLGWKDQID